MWSRITKLGLLAALVVVLSPIARAQYRPTLIQSSPEPLPNCTPATTGQLQPQIWDTTAQQMKTCTGTNTWSQMGGPGGGFYQTIQVNGVAQTQELTWNAVAGTNMTITPTTVGGVTTLTFTASVTAATAFSAITPATNTNAGSFIASGNTWNFAAAAALIVPTAGIQFPGSTSGTTTILPPATGIFTDSLPGANGTFAVAATGPVVLSALGNISCPTCNTSGATVSSVGLTQTGSVFTITNTPITSSGNINIAFASEPANEVLASPNGVSGVLSVRALVGADIPAINLAVGGNGGVTGTLPTGNLPATVVLTNQSNTYSTGAQNFSSATSFTIPIGSSAAPTVNGQIAFNSTNNNYAVGIGGTDYVLPWVGLGVPVPGQCATWTGTLGQQTSTACGTGTINSASQYSFPYYSAAGTNAVLSGVAAPTTNGFWQIVYNVTGSAPIAPVVQQFGLAPRDVTGTTSTDTILFSDLVVDYQGSVAVATSLPTPTTLGNPHFVVRLVNNISTTNSVTLTAAGSFTFQSTGSATLAIMQGQQCLLTVDPVSSTQWDDLCGDLPYTAGTNITITRGQYGPTISASTASGVSSISGDGALYTNSSSTGAVTLVLGSAGADKVWGNCTSSSATPSYCLIVQAMLPSNIVYNNQNNTYTTGLQQFASATLGLPSIASYAPTTAALIGYDSTNNRLALGNGTNTSFPTWITAAPTNTHISYFNGTFGLLADSGYAYNAIPLADLATESANTVVGNFGGSTAAPSANSMPGGIQNYVAGTGLNAATAHQMSAPYQCADTSSSATTYTCTTTPSLGALTKGDAFILTSVNQNNSGDSTLNIDSIGAVHIRKWQNTATLAAGDLQANAAIELVYDGTYFEAPTIGNAPSGGSGPSVIYSTVASSSPTGGTTNSVSSTTMVTPGANHVYQFAANIVQTAATVGCATQPTVQINFSYKDSTSSTGPGGVQLSLDFGGSMNPTITTTQASGNIPVIAWSAPVTLFAASGTAVAFSTTVATGTGCSTGAAYSIQPMLIQLQ